MKREVVVTTWEDASGIRHRVQLPGGRVVVIAMRTDCGARTTGGRFLREQPVTCAWCKAGHWLADITNTLASERAAA